MVESRLKPTRRQFLIAASLCGAGVLITRRFTCYEDTNWKPLMLTTAQGLALAAAAEVMVPDGPGPTGLEVAKNVDKFLAGMPQSTLRELDGLFLLLEHGTLIGGSLRRLTGLSPEDRLEFLNALSTKTGLLGDAFEGLRALVYSGWYQDRRTWAVIGYTGPWINRGPRPLVPGASDAGVLAKWVAGEGARMRGLI